MMPQVRFSLVHGLCSSTLVVAGILGVASALISTPAQATAISFSCGTSNGAPSTVAITDDGRSVPMIRWTSNVFDSAGWTPERRCQEVSKRFDTYRQKGLLNFITTGRMNSLPVICAARTKGGACDGLLYTLKPGQDPGLALNRLLDVRLKARGPINETSSRPYISINDLLASDSGISAVNPAPQEKTVKPLW